MMFSDRLAVMRRRDDRGASLVLALIFITVIAVAIAAVLSLADANLRATVALRKQATESAGAEAAAQIAIDKLRHSSYVSGSACFDGASTLTLDNAYRSPDGSALPAVVSCAPDATTSFVSSLTRPGYALLTLPAANGTEAGIDIHVNGSGRVAIGGNAATQSFINNKGPLDVHGNFFAHTNGDCSTSAVTVTGVKTCTAASIPNIPVYSAPALPDNVPVYTNATPKPCDKRIEFQPGLYPDLALLTGALNCNKAVVYDFRPGVYYFSYTGLWDIDQGTLIGGDDTPTGTSAPAIPHACPDISATASATKPLPDSGVTFVFGGRARSNRCSPMAPRWSSAAAGWTRPRHRWRCTV